MKVFHREHCGPIDARLVAFLDWWEANGPYPVTIPPDGGFRSDTVQQALYAKGRTTAGPNAGLPGHPKLGSTVTNAPTAHDSAHGRGAALDLLPVQTTEDGTRVVAVMDGEWRLFQLLGYLAEAHGFVWGGRFHSPVDGPHVECADWKTLPIPKETPNV